MRGDRRRVLGRFFADGGVPRGFLRVEPLTPLERLIELPDYRAAVADQRDLGRFVLVHRLRFDVELNDSHILVVPGRQAEMHDPVEPSAHQEHDVGLLQREAAGRADRKRVVVGHHALAHRGGKERQLRALDKGSHFSFRAGGRHALADNDQRALRRLEDIQRLLDIFRHRLHPRRLGATLHLVHVVGVAGAGNQVVGDVEVGGAGPAVDRLPHRHFHVERDAMHMLDGVRPFTHGGCAHDLAFLLERAHAVAVRFGCAADQQHRPAILLRVGQAREAVDHAGAGDDDARSRAPGHVADGAGGVGRGLLIPHADIGKAGFLGCVRQGADWEPDHPKHKFHALLFKAFCQQISTFDFSHYFLLLSGHDGARLSKPG